VKSRTIVVAGGLISPMDYACLVSRSAARSLAIRKVQVLQSKCLRIATIALWYTDTQANSRWFGSPLLYRPYHITNWEIRLKVSWCGEPLSYAAWQIFTLTKRRPEFPTAGRSGSTTCPGYQQGGHVDTLNRAQLALFDYPDRVFRDFSSVVRQMPGYNTQRRGTARISPA